MTSTIIQRFGNKVRAERLKRGLSQEGLAEKAELHRTYIGMIERGEKNITLVNVEKLSKSFNLSLSDLFQDL